MASKTLQPYICLEKKCVQSPSDCSARSLFLSSSDHPGNTGPRARGLPPELLGRDVPGACRWPTLPWCSRGRQKLSLCSGFGFRNASWSTLNLFQRACLSPGLVEPLMDCCLNCTSSLTEHRTPQLLREQFGSVDFWQLEKIICSLTEVFFHLLRPHQLKVDVFFPPFPAGRGPGWLLLSRSRVGFPPRQPGARNQLGFALPSPAASSAHALQQTRQRAGGLLICQDFVVAE